MHLLVEATNAGDTESIVGLLRDGATSQPILNLGLARACCLGHIDAATKLYAGGANPNGEYIPQGGRPGYGPVITAAYEFLSVEGIQSLLSVGANPHVDGLIEMIDTSYERDDERRVECLKLLIAAAEE